MQPVTLATMKLLYFLAVLPVIGGCTTTPVASAPAAFFERLTALCGKAFAGRLVTSEAADANMAGKAMVMAVDHCTPSEIRIPFHVESDRSKAGEDGWDRSRTWIVTRTGSGLRLKHDHRHRDGKPDPVTLYGGDTALPGTAIRQEFPVDTASIASFRANGLPRSVTNVWAVEVEPTRFAYELHRFGANERHFRVEFDLTVPVPAPPKAWGW